MSVGESEANEMQVMHISMTDEYAANTIAARQARTDGMPQTGKRHDEAALHMQNASRWAMANCPKGYSVQFTIHCEFVPNINPYYKGDSDIYTHKD